MKDAAQSTVVSVAAWNWKDAVFSGGLATTEGRRNIKQMFTAQPWARAGFSYQYKLEHFEK